MELLVKMETPVETLGSNTSDSHCNRGFIPAAVIVKGKRTKRRRIHLPPVSSAVAVDSSPPDTSSAEASGSITEEEEDMANCLILLAQGRDFDAGLRSDEDDGDGGGGGGGGIEKFTSRNFTEAATTTTADGKAGLYVYECRTCNKSFPSFQALGGHRASHNKPKWAIAIATIAENKKAMVDEDPLQISRNPLSKAAFANTQGNIKPKIHECSVCGSEFSSGQALGGHMRRHRPLTTSSSQEDMKERSFLSLDLNLPAPPDDEQDELRRPASPAFMFAGSRPLVLSVPSALVDCHY